MENRGDKLWPGKQVISVSFPAGFVLRGRALMEVSGLQSLNCLHYGPLQKHLLISDVERVQILSVQLVQFL